MWGIGVTSLINVTNSQFNSNSSNNDRNDHNDRNSLIEDSLFCLAHIIKSLDEWSSQHKVNVQSKYEDVRKKKQLYSKAIDDFNADPVHNVMGLVKSGLVKENAHEIASFFHSHRNLLSSSAVGLVLGNSKPFLNEIMHEYVDMVDFSQMSLIEGLYYFLSLFRLPPETQEVDRIIEKFRGFL